MPLRRDITAHCSCPDDDSWDDRACKHVVAAMFVLSDEFLLEPELLDVWRGREPGSRSGSSASDEPTGDRPLREHQAGERSHLRLVHSVPGRTRSSDATGEFSLVPDVSDIADDPPDRIGALLRVPDGAGLPEVPVLDRVELTAPRRQELGTVLTRCSPPHASRLGLTSDYITEHTTHSTTRFTPGLGASPPTSSIGPHVHSHGGRQRLAGDRCVDRQRRTGRTRQERRDPPRVVLPADRGAPAARRRAGHRKDEPRQGDRRVDRRHLEACPVHARPPAHRHHRRHGVRPERWLVLVPRGPGLHERADR